MEFQVSKFQYLRAHFSTGTRVEDGKRNFCKIRQFEVQRRPGVEAWGEACKWWAEVIFHTSVPYIINGRFFRFLGQFRGPRTPLTSSLSRHTDVNDRIVPCRIHLPSKSRLLFGSEAAREL